MKPAAQKRHRHTHAGRVYDPSQADKKAFLVASRRICPVLEPMVCALKVTLVFYFQRPKSHYTKKGALTKRAPLMMTRKPDCDNCVKYVLDALNGVYYKDDAQVCVLSATKTYVQDGSSEGVSVTLERIA